MCLDDQILNTFMDEELSEPWRTQVIEHLRYCPACSARLEQLRSLHELIVGTTLGDQEIERSQAKVFEFIERNYIDQKRPFQFLRKSFRIKMPTALALGAASVLIFGLLLFMPRAPKGGSDELIPVVSPTVAGSVTSVRSTENLSAAQLLENFTLEEILKYLSSRGYEVEVKMKGIFPFEAAELEEILEDLDF